MARALYAKGTTAEEAARFGLTLEEAQGTPTEVWPCNVLAVNVLVAMDTQWRSSPNGPLGLDYAALPFVMRTVGVKASERSAVFEALRVLEVEALKTMKANAK